MHIWSCHSMTSKVFMAPHCPQNEVSAAAQALVPIYLSSLMTHIPPKPLESRPGITFTALNGPWPLHLGFWPCSSPYSGHSCPSSPHLSSSLKFQHGNHFQEGFFRHTTPPPPTSPLYTHILPKVGSMCLSITPPTKLSHVAVFPNRLCMLFEGSFVH